MRPRVDGAIAQTHSVIGFRAAGSGGAGLAAGPTSAPTSPGTLTRRRATRRRRLRDRSPLTLPPAAPERLARYACARRTSAPPRVSGGPKDTPPVSPLKQQPKVVSLGAAGSTPRSRRACSLGTAKTRSPARPRIGPVSSRRRTAASCSSTRCKVCPPPPSGSSVACSGSPAPLPPTRRRSRALTRVRRSSRVLAQAADALLRASPRLRTSKLPPPSQ